ncbi:ATP-binding protein [Anoxynatronum sibiricum]|uniref:ATP-binding protein n=1 Tax=Anoxynatronum sibiricum TaxID=210623 RepID=A0ABU9VY27_9CLOT
MKELALHILDIVQNSISADASHISISIHEDTVADRLEIHIKDNGKGMDTDLLNSVKNPFTTTRKTRRVGLGIPLLNQAAQECDGNLEIKSVEKCGTDLIAWFRLSHIDRMPLGNMAETIALILMSDNDFDLQYEHRFNQRKLTFNTQELRLMLEDVPLNHPDVVAWIKQSLQEEIDELYQQPNKG